jgi:DNA-binding IclR family transcriptional regulator
VSEAQYLNSSQQRILGLLRCLAGNEMEGLAPGDIAKLNSCSASHVTRDLANLHHAGLAEQLPNTGRWRLGPQIVQIAMRHMTALDRAQSRLDETKNRFSRS